MNINELIEIFENVNTSFNGKGVTQNSNSIYQSCIAFFGVYGEFTISFTDTTKNYTIVYPKLKNSVRDVRHIRHMNYKIKGYKSALQTIFLFYKDDAFGRTSLRKHDSSMTCFH